MNSRESIQRLREMAPKLNERADHINHLIVTLQNLLLDEWKVTVNCFGEPYKTVRDFHPETKEPVTTEHRLAYGRCEKKFQFYVLFQTFDFDKELLVQKSTPWIECKRETKLDSFSSTPALIAQIVTEVENLSKLAEGTVATVEELLSAFKGEPDGNVR